MKALVGDSIRIESDKAGTPPRPGKILEILPASFGTRYRVRWDDGHESTVHPRAGTVAVRHADDEGSWQIVGG